MIFIFNRPEQAKLAVEVYEKIENVEDAHMICKYFYRVTVKLDDPRDQCSLAFDFRTMEDAALFAEKAYIACDIVKVKIEIIENEIDTTNSPMWRK